MDDAVTSGHLAPSFWRDTLAPYAIAGSRGAPLLDVATSAVPYLALTALMYAARDVSTVLVLALALPATGFLVRTFIVFHDCAHGSFLALATRQHVARRGLRPARLLAVSQLASRARGPSRHRGRPRPARDGRRRHADRGRVLPAARRRSGSGTG